MSSSPLIELAYLSKSTGERNAREEDDAFVERIVESAREFNTSLDVTGILLTGERCFAQVLEGPASAVDEIFEQRVLPATSHTDVLLLSRRLLPARSFQDWSMALVRDQTGCLDRFVEHRAWEIETASSLSEPPANWPLYLLFAEVSRIVNRVTSIVPVEKMMTDRASSVSASP